MPDRQDSCSHSNLQLAAGAGCQRQDSPDSVMEVAADAGEGHLPARCSAADAGSFTRQQPAAGGSRGGGGGGGGGVRMQGRHRLSIVGTQHQQSQHQPAGHQQPQQLPAGAGPSTADAAEGAAANSSQQGAAPW
jgi:hypothetical protein